MVKKDICLVGPDKQNVFWPINYILKMHSLILMSRIGPGYCWWSVAKTHFFVIWNFLKFYEINSSNISIFFYLIKKKIVVDKIYQYLTFFTERRYFPIQLKYIFNQSKFAFDKDDFIRFPEIFLQVWEIFFHSKKYFFVFFIQSFSGVQIFSLYLKNSEF